MRKLYSSLLKAVMFVFCLSTAKVFAQTTLNTTTVSGFSNNNGTGMMLFNFQNTNGYDIIITDVESIVNGTGSVTAELWTRPTPLSGATYSGGVSVGTGWALAATGTFTGITNTTTLVTQPMLTGISVTIPANSTYAICIAAYSGTTTRLRYHTIVSPNIPATTVSGGGCNILMGNGSAGTLTNTSFGAAAIPPATTATYNNPRGFLGKITFIPAAPCTSPPTPGTATSNVSTICSGNTVNLNLTGNSTGAGQTYVWQKSTDPAPPHTWTDISSSSSAIGLSVVPSTTTFYRAAVTCSGVTSYSDSVKVIMNPAFPAGTYTINQTLPVSSTNFQSFAAAVSAINCGVSGNVVFNVSADQTFNEDIPVINPIGSSSATIIFQKSGTGANPKIVPLSSGTIASSATLGSDGDGIIVLNGTDYITFDGIDLDASAGFSGNGMYEYGYYLKKASGTDACKNVVIKNSAITLIKTAIYSFGIFVSNNSGTASVTVTTTGGRTENIKIFNNTINGCYSGINVTGYAAASPYDLYDQNVEIGVDGANIIDQYAGGASTGYGIYAIYQNNLKVANNTVTSSSGTTTTLYGIFLSTGTNSNVDIYGNTITITGGATTSTIYALNNAMGATGTSNLVKIYNNTITNCTYPTATTGVMYLLYQNASAYKAHIYNNNVTNNTHSPTTTAAMYCLYQSGAVVNESKIYNNTVSNNQKSTGTTGSVYLIYHSPASTANGDIYGNTVSVNSSTNTTSGTLYGIYHASGATTNIYKNKIFDLTSNSTGGSLYGIAATAGTTNNIYNNFVSDLKAPAVSSADAIRGISITATAASTTENVSYNTIYLNASSSGTNFGTSAVYHTVSGTATTAALTLRNNNLVNVSIPAGTGLTTVFRRSGTALDNYTNASDKNNLFAGSGGNPANVLFYDGTNSDVDLNAFKTRMATRDNSSVSEEPPFEDIAAAPYDLRIKTTVPTQLESGGAPVSGITDDYFGTARNASSPDIGAHEFIGISADFTGPAISYTALGNTICTDQRTITATITDASGVNITAGTKPRLWFKKAYENDILPATNTSAGNGWKWVEASNATSPFTFTIDYSLLSSPIVAGDSISYFVVAQDNIATPNVGANTATFTTTPASVALSGSAFPVTGSVKGYNILSQPTPLTVKISRNELCVSGTITLDLDGVTAPGGSYQWQSSAAGANTWSDVSGATTIPYTSGTINSSTDYRLVIKCGGSPIASSPSNVVSVTVNNPQVLTTTPGSRCGVGTVNLSATGNAGTNLNWYSASTGGTPLFTGANFTTPSINATTNYYVSASFGGTTTNVGMPAAITTTSSGVGTTNFGLVFDVFAPFTLNKVTLYPVSASSASGTVTIDVINGSGTIVHQAVVNVTGSPSGSVLPQTVNLNFNIQPGTNYKLRPGSFTGISGLLFEPSSGAPGGNYGYPFTVPGVVSINTSTLTAAPTNTARNDLYYYFYNWEISTGCEGSRTAVTATVTPAPALTVTANKTICNNSIHMLQVTSTISDFDSYVWSPQTNLFTDAAATIPYTGGNASQVYVKSSTAGGVTYTLTATNTITQCANAATSVVTVLPDPTINAVPAEICVSGTSALSLNPSSGYGAGTLQWQMSTDGATYNDVAGATTAIYTTPTITQTRYYKVVLKDGDGTTCSQSPTITVIVNNPQITGTTPGSRCGDGAVTLGATGNAGSTVNWYAASTGGTPLATGTSFITPTLSSNTTYYVSASTGAGGISNVGPSGPAALGGAGGGTSVAITTYHMLFDVLVPTTLVSVDIFPTAAIGSSSSITIQNSSGTTIASVPYTTTVTGGATAQTIPLNVSLTPGTGYKMGQLAPSIALFRNTSGAVYPYTSSAINITGNNFDPAYYYYVYNWQFSTSCESARTPVLATINHAVSNAAGASGTTECGSNTIAGSTDFNYTDCDPIAIITPNGASPVSGNVNACVTIDASLQTAPTGEPYVQRHYDITPTANPATVTSIMTLYFLQSEFNAFNAASGFYAQLPTGPADAAGKANLRITQYNGTGTAPGNYTGTALQIDPVDANINWNSTSNRWEVTFAATGSGGFYVHTGKFVLPVTGLELKGNLSGSVNRLSWSTNTEINNRGFELQRSADGINFSGLAFVATKAENGNSTSPLNYNCEDAKPFAGNTYYRLKQMDKDGKITYSNTILLSRKVTDIMISSIYPNPAEKELNFVISTPKAEKITIIVTDVSGKVVMQQPVQLVNGENLQKLSVQSLAAGTYIIKAVCANGCETAVQRFFKQ